MAAKMIKAVAVTGQLVYAVIRRDADGFLMDDSDGSFAAAPTDFFFDLPEDGTVKGLYFATEDRTPWNNGNYVIIPYIQTGGSPVIALDLPGEAEVMAIYANAEVTCTSTITTTVQNASTSLGLKKSMGLLQNEVTDIIKQIRILLDHILDLEKKVLRGFRKD